MREVEREVKKKVLEVMIQSFVFFAENLKDFGKTEGLIFFEDQSDLCWMNWKRAWQDI